MFIDLLASDAPLSRVALIGTTVCAVWASALTVWVVRASVKRRRSRALFESAAFARGFSRQESRDLWNLALRAGNGSGKLLLDSVEAFDQCVAGVRQKADGHVLALPEYLTDSWVSSVRRRLAPSRRALHNITDTHELETNQPVRVRLPNGAAFSAFVTEAGPDSLQLAMTGNDRSLRFTQEQKLQVTFSRPLDARYEFVTDVLREPKDSRTLYAAHAPVRRFQQREHVRVRCRESVRFTYAKSEQVRDLESLPDRPELPHVGTLQDISVGGACLTTNAAPPEGARVLVRVALKRAPWAATVPARIIRHHRLNGTSGAVSRLSLKFEPLGTREEYQLGQHVAGIQQEMIRRMLVRAGVKDESLPLQQGVTPVERPKGPRPTVKPELPEEPARLPDVTPALKSPVQV